MDKNAKHKKSQSKKIKKTIPKSKPTTTIKKKIAKPEPQKKTLKKIIENDSQGHLGLFSMPEKLVVIGDVHADYEALTQTLEKAGLINSNLDWTGRKTTVIIIGDLVDGKSRVGNWDESSDLKVIQLINNLEIKAREKEGRIIILLGNHEFMNMNGNFNYSGNSATKEFGGEQSRINYFKNEFKSFAKKCFLAVQFGDWVFCHAGIPVEISNILKITDLNGLLDRYLNGRMNATEYGKFNTIISGKSGILTNREFGMDEIHESRLKKTLENLNANYMVVGHTVQRKLNSVANGKLWRVDTGMSRAFGENNENRKSFLLIYDFGNKTKIFR